MHIYSTSLSTEVVFRDELSNIETRKLYRTKKSQPNVTYKKLLYLNVSGKGGGGRSSAVRAPSFNMPCFIIINLFIQVS